jgi:Uncharacterized conserved protein
MTNRLRWIPIALLPLAAATARAQTVTVDNIDKNHSTLGFSVPIMGGLSEVEGKFTDFSIVIKYDTTDVTKSSVVTTIETKSIDTGIGARDDDLRGARFFEADKYPQIIFTSSRIERRGKQLVAIGTLNMHGVTKPLELPFTIRTVQDPQTKGLNMAVSSDLTIDRDDWGVSWRHPKNMFVSNEVDAEAARAHQGDRGPAPALKLRVRFEDLPHLVGRAHVGAVGEQSESVTVARPFVREISDGDEYHRGAAVAA